MKVIAPVAMTNAILASSNVAENDYAEWDISTTYAQSAYVIVIGTTHKVYQSVQGSNLGNDPTTDDGTWWTEIGATNRWKAFDSRISDVVTNSGSIEYGFTPATSVTGLVCLGLNAGSVSVTVTDTAAPRRNLLVRSEEIDNASWSKAGTTVTANATTDPFGGSTADKMVENSATSAHNVSQAYAVTTGTRYCLSAYLKAGERTQMTIQMGATGFGTAVSLKVDLSDGSTVSTTGTVDASSVEDVGNGWYRCSVVATATASASTVFVLYLLDESGNPSYTGDGSSGAFVYGVQLETLLAVETAPTAYQWITTASVFDQETFTETRDLVDNTSVGDWFAYFFDAIAYDTEAIFDGIPGYASTTTISVDIDAGAGTAEVGQVVIGKVETLGETLEGTRLGIRDFSFKDFDAFGRAQIVERRFARNVDFSFAMPATAARRVDRLLAALRATPAVYFADASVPEYGAVAFGFFRDFDIPLQHQGRAFVTLEIEGLT